MTTYKALQEYLSGKGIMCSIRQVGLCLMNTIHLQSVTEVNFDPALKIWAVMSEQTTYICKYLQIT